MFSPRDLLLPLVGAPMAGGPSTPELVSAVARAGGLGMIAAGYLTAARLAEVIDATAALCDDPTSRRSADRPSGSCRSAHGRIGVNLFVPDPDASEGWRGYRDLLAEAFPGVDLPAEPRWSDDDWDAKLALLTGGSAAGACDAVSTVAFTFGLPEQAVVHALNEAGKSVGVTVTRPVDAQAALDVGADYLIVQGPGAGGHQSTFTVAEIPATADSDEAQSATAELVRSVRALTEEHAKRIADDAPTVPIIAAGGVGGRPDVRALLAAGADAVQVGTLLLTADEAGTRRPHREALLARDRDTVLTRCFSGRLARALVNDFTLRYTDVAPAAYPHVHYLTSPIRAAAADAGDAEGLNLWAGVGHRSCRAASAAELLEDLAP